jgi:hypothetical protein
MARAGAATQGGTMSAPVPTATRPIATGALDGVSIPLVVALGAFALVRPVLSITGLAEAWGKPATPLVATALITAVWVAVVVATRQARPVVTLVGAGLTYAVLATLMSAILSPILDGELRGPLAFPPALIGVLWVNALWGAAAGTIASTLTNRSRYTVTR